MSKARTTGGVYRRGAVWWIYFNSNGRQRHESAHSDKRTMAEDFLKKRLAEVTTGSYLPGAAQVKVSELLDEVVLDYEVNQKCDRAARSDKKVRPFFGDKPAAKVTTALIGKYVSKRREEGAANATINRELAHLRRAFNLGAEATPPKVARVPKFPRLAESAPRKGFFEDDAFLLLRPELPEYLVGPFTFAYYTGCRKGEILSLQWDQVDLLEKVIRLEPGTTKNDEARTIPLADDLYQVLAMQKSIRDERWPDCPLVFSREGKPISDHLFYEGWREACKRAGLAGGRAKLFHDLRRTGVRNLVRAGVPEAVAMRISGHKTRSVFDRYNIVSERDLREAAGKLSSYLREKRGAVAGTITETITAPSRQAEPTPPKLLN